MQPADVAAARQPWGLLVGTGIALGAAVPLGKMAVTQGVAPISFVLFPVLAAALLLGAIAMFRHGLPRGPWSLLGFGLVTGVLGNAVPNTLTAWLSAQAGAGITAIAFTLPPVFTLGLALLLRFEPVRMRRLAAVGLGLLGAVWLATSRVMDAKLTWTGALTLLAIPAALAAGNIYRARFLPQRVPAEWLGAAMSAGAFVVLLPIWLLSPAAASSVTAAGLPYLCAQVICGALGAVLFFRLQRRADAVAMSFVGYAMAITAVLLGALVLREQLPWQLLPAAALIGAGFLLIQRTPRRPQA